MAWLNSGIDGEIHYNVMFISQCGMKFDGSWTPEKSKQTNTKTTEKLGMKKCSRKKRLLQGNLAIQ